MAHSRSDYLRSLNQMRDGYQNQGNPLINNQDDSTDPGQEISSFAYMDTPAPQPQASDNWWVRGMDTLNDVNNNVMRGAYNFFDSVFDWTINTLNWMGAVSDEDRDNITGYDWQSQALRINDIPRAFTSGRLFDSDYWSPDSFTEKGSQDILGKIERNSLQSEMGWAGDMAKGVEQSIGFMLPSIAIGGDVGEAIGALQSIPMLETLEVSAETASKIASLATMGVGAYASKTNEVYGDTKNYGRASLAGLSSAAIEIGTEIIGDKLGLSKVLGVFGKNNGALSKWIKVPELFKEMLGEGFEEVLSGVLEPIVTAIGTADSWSDAMRMIAEKHGDLNFWFDITNSESVLAQGMAGALSGGVMSGFSIVQKNAQFTKEGAKWIDKFNDLSGEYQNNFKQYAKDLEKVKQGDETALKRLREATSAKNAELGKMAEELGKDFEKLSPKAQQKILDSFLDPKSVEALVKKTNPDNIEEAKLKLQTDKLKGEIAKYGKSMQQTLADMTGESLSTITGKSFDIAVLPDSEVAKLSPSGSEATAFYDSANDRIVISQTAADNAIVAKQSHELFHDFFAKHPQDTQNLIDKVSSIKGIDSIMDSESLRQTVIENYSDLFANALAYNSDGSIDVNKTYENIQRNNNYLNAYNQELMAHFLEGIITTPRELIKVLKATNAYQLKNKLSSILNRARNSLTAKGRLYNTLGEAIQKVSAIDVTNQRINLGNGIYMNKEGSLMFSKTTYDEGGRDKLRAEMKKLGHTDAEITELVTQLDEISDTISNLAENLGYKGMEAALNTAAIVDEVTGKPILSCLVANGEYAINFDLSATCKKREALQKVVTFLAKNNFFNDANFFDKEGKMISKIHEMLAAEGLETPCKMCFVESRRLFQQQWAYKTFSLWNKAVLEMFPEVTERYDFAGKTVSSRDILLGDAIVDSDIENALKSETDSEEEKPSKSLEKRVRDIVAIYAKEHGTPKLLSYADLLTGKGLIGVRKLSGKFFSVLKSSYGAGTPKLNYPFIPYNSEALMLAYTSIKELMNDKAISGLKDRASAIRKADTTKKMSGYESRVEALRRILYEIGGIRNQSFSDAQITQVFDMCQLFADVSAMEFPMHIYTKEAWFAKLFSMMSAKINMSLISNLYAETNNKELAGLRECSKEEFDKVMDTKNGGHGVGISKDGKYYVSDFVSSNDIKEATKSGTYKTKTGSPIQSFPMDKAMEILGDANMSKNVGTIAIAFSDAHARALLDSPYISMVIPYHKSGVIKMFAHQYHFDGADDYTAVQSTKIDESSVKIFDAEGNDVTSEIKLSASLKKRIAKVFNDEFGNFNKLLREASGDAPRVAASQYLENCRKGFDEKKIKIGGEVHSVTCKFIPKFSQFADSPNYYKVLADFSLYDSEGNYQPQQAVNFQMHPDWKSIIEKEAATGNAVEKATEVGVRNVEDQLVKEFGWDPENTIYESRKAKKSDYAKIASKDAKPVDNAAAKQSEPSVKQEATQQSEQDAWVNQVLETQAKDEAKLQKGIDRANEKMKREWAKSTQNAKEERRMRDTFLEKGTLTAPKSLVKDAVNNGGRKTYTSFKDVKEVFNKALTSLSEKRGIKIKLNTSDTNQLFDEYNLAKTEEEKSRAIMHAAQNLLESEFYDDNGNRVALGGIASLAEEKRLRGIITDALKGKEVTSDIQKWIDAVARSRGKLNFRIKMASVENAIKNATKTYYSVANSTMPEIESYKSIFGGVTKDLTNSNVKKLADNVIANYTKESFGNMLGKHNLEMNEAITYLAEELSSIQKGDVMTEDITQKVFGLVNLIKEEMKMLGIAIKGENAEYALQAVVQAQATAKNSTVSTNKVKNGIAKLADSATSPIVLLEEALGRDHELTKLVRDEGRDAENGYLKDKSSLESSYENAKKKSGITDKQLSEKIEIAGVKVSRSQAIAWLMYADSIGADEFQKLKGNITVGRKTKAISFAGNFLANLETAVGEKGIAFAKALETGFYAKDAKDYVAKAYKKQTGLELPMGSGVYAPLFRSPANASIGYGKSVSLNLNDWGIGFLRERVANRANLDLNRTAESIAFSYIDKVSRWSNWAGWLKKYATILNTRIYGTNLASILPTIVNDWDMLHKFIVMQAVNAGGTSPTTMVGKAFDFVATGVGSANILGLNTQVKTLSSAFTLAQYFGARNFGKALLDLKGNISPSELKARRAIIEKYSPTLSNRFATNDVLEANLVKQVKGKVYSAISSVVRNLDMWIHLSLGYSAAYEKILSQGTYTEGSNEFYRAVVREIEYASDRTQPTTTFGNVAFFRSKYADTMTKRVFGMYMSMGQAIAQGLREIAIGWKAEDARIKTFESESERYRNRANEYRAKKAELEKGFELLFGDERIAREAQIKDAGDHIESNEASYKTLKQAAEAMKKTHTGKGFANKAAGYAVGLVGSSFVLIALNEIWKRLAGKKDWDEWDLGEITLDGLSKTFLDWIPYVGTLVNSIRNNSDLSIYTLDTVNGFIDLATSAVPAFSSGNVQKVTSWMTNSIEQAASLFGIPLKNWLTLATGITYMIDKEAGINAKLAVGMYSMSSLSKGYSKSLEDGRLGTAKANLSVLMNTYGAKMSDSVADEIVRLEANGCDCKPSVRSTYYYNEDGARVDFSKSELTAYRKAYDGASDVVERIMSLTSYSKLDDESKAKVIKQVYSVYSDFAKWKAVGKKPSGLLAKLMVSTNGDLDLAKYIAHLQRLSSISPASDKTKKELVLAEINSISGMTKAERALLAYLAGYKPSADSKAVLEAYLRSVGVTDMSDIGL